MSADTLPPLSSLPSSYVHAYDGHSLRALAIVFTIFEIIFIGLRYLSKVVGRTPFGLDDLLITAALIFCLAFNATAFVDLNISDLGIHSIVAEETAPQKLVPFAQFLVACPMLYNIANCLSRLAILVFYSRIFNVGICRIINFVLMGLIIANTLASTIASGLECIPLQFLWDKTISGHCFDLSTFYQYMSFPNVIIDVAMLFLPIPIVWQLHATTRVKIGLAVTFLTGSLGLIASILRTVAFFQHNITIDGTWVAIIFFDWAIVEAGCYLFAACIMCLRPLLICIARQRNGRNSSNSRTGRSHPGVASLFRSNNGFVAPHVADSVPATRIPQKRERETEDQEMLVGGQIELDRLGRRI